MRYNKGSFITVPNLTQLKGLKPQEQCLYMWLCYHANQTGTCFPSHKRLAELTGTSVDTVKRSILKLEQVGILKKTNRVKNNEKLTNIYEIIIRGVGADSTEVSAHSTEGVGAEKAIELNPLSLTKSTIAADAAEGVFSLKDELEKMKESLRKDIRLVGYYFGRKKPNIPSKLVFKKEMGRALAEAKTLQDYASDKVKQAMDYADANYPLWTLQTIGKIITNIN